MANVIDTPLRLICELTVEGALAGHYQLEVQRRVEDDAGVELVKPEVKTVDLTSEAGAEILQSEAAAKAAEVQALSGQVQGYRNEIAGLEKRLDAAVEALNAVAAADRSWDDTVRANLGAVLTAEA